MKIPVATSPMSNPPQAIDVIEHLTTGALLLDAELRLVELNAAAEALLELSARQSAQFR